MLAVAGEAVYRIVGGVLTVVVAVRFRVPVTVFPTTVVPVVLTGRAVSVPPTFRVFAPSVRVPPPSTDAEKRSMLRAAGPYWAPAALIPSRS